MKKNVMFRTKEERDFADAVREDIITLNSKIQIMYITVWLLSLTAIVLASIALFRT